MHDQIILTEKAKALVGGNTINNNRLTKKAKALIRGKAVMKREWLNQLVELREPLTLSEPDESRHHPRISQDDY